MDELIPNLKILPEPQKRLWKELSALPKEFALYGGTALALRLGHRNSVDFYFFSNRQIDIQTIESKISFLSGAKIIQRDKNTLSAIVDRDGPVKVSFFGAPNLPRLAPAHVVKENGLQVASMLDLAGAKASVVQVRAEAKDYIDIDALITLGKVGLPTALAAAQKIYGSSFNPEITLKALSYFDDGNLRGLPDDMKHRLAAAAREVDLDRLPALENIVSRGVSKDRGYGL